MILFLNLLVLSQQLKMAFNRRCAWYANLKEDQDLLMSLKLLNNL